MMIELARIIMLLQFSLVLANVTHNLTDTKIMQVIKFGKQIYPYYPLNLV